MNHLINSLRTNGSLVKSLVQASNLLKTSTRLPIRLAKKSDLSAISCRYFSIYGLRCNAQAKPIIKAFNEEEVKEIKIDKTKRESYAVQDKNFSDYNLPETLLASLKKLGYDKPFPIQEETLKHSLEGKDLIGKAITGSGKTLAFGIPIINKVLNSPNRTKRFPKCLVLSPTRELCAQLQTTIQSLSSDVKCVAIYGGASMESQIRQLNERADVVCATPGRLKDLMRRKNFSPECLELICLDEADELLRPSFLDDIRDVLGTAQSKQVLMFSATINDDVKEVVDEFMKDPVKIDLTKGQQLKVPENVKQFEMVANQKAYPDIIAHLINKYQSEKCIVFVNRKAFASEIRSQLYDFKIRSQDLHSDHNQTKRERVFKDFKTGRLNVLVATDVAARGLDVPEIDLIIHVGLPPSGIDYFIHRSGRTGRAGRSGVSVVLHSNGSNDRSILKDVKRQIRITPLAIPDEIKQKFGNDIYPDEENDYDRRPFRKTYGGSYKDRTRSYSERPSYRSRSNDNNLDRVYSGKINNKNYQFKDDSFFNRSKPVLSSNKKSDHDDLSDK